MFSLPVTLFLVVLSALFMYRTDAIDTQCGTYDYSAAANAHRNDAQELAGFTRSVLRQNLFTLLAPDSRVYSAPPPGWQGDVSSAAVITPALGAHFSMYIVEVKGDATLPQPVTFDSAPHLLERFLYVLSGAMQITNGTNETVLEAGGFAYFSPADESSSVKSSNASLVQIDRVYAGIGGAASSVGIERDVETERTSGEVFRLRRLLNASDRAIDFNIHIMDFSPGEYLNVKEVHYNQHGLFMLQGHGIYRLGDTFFPVGTGDVIYLAPFVPQWYAALGSISTRYFLYKDVNVDPLKI